MSPDSLQIIQEKYKGVTKSAKLWLEDYMMLFKTLEKGYFGTTFPANMD